MNLEEITIAAGNLAKQVGTFIQAEAQHFSSDKVEIKSFNQLVSYVDKTAEEKLVAGLSAIFPQAGFITEEETIASEQKEYMWVIDPLDGTTNFVHQLPVYSISIGLLHHHIPVIGVVYEPNRHELFYGWKNGGAYLNGKRISVKQNPLLESALLATGFPYYDFDLIGLYLNTLQEILKTTRGMRRMGSAAVDLAYVACGRFDGFFEYGLNPWDVAGGILLVTEAGGKATMFDGSDDAIFGREIIASSTAIYPSFSEVVRRGFRK
jgi:myo-inositol-1(or 4)-monophosphatase